MKEKQKSKFNPFAQVLYPDEEILWFYTPSPYVVNFKTLTRYNLFIVASLVTLLGLCSVMLFLIKIGLPVEALFRVFNGLLYLTLYFVIASFPLHIVTYISTFVFSPLPRAYAVTDLRLLTYEVHEVTTMALEEVNLLRHTRRTISFGTSLSVWTDLEDTGTLVTLIEQARAKRIYRLNMAHEDKHGEETEEQVQSLRTGAASR